MNNSIPILKRELKVYFTSPIAYAVMVIFLVVAGYLFASSILHYSLLSIQAAQNPYMELNVIEVVLMPLFGSLGFVLLFIIPALTMRLLAEEKKTGTYELLFTYPVRDVEVMIGKFLAALVILAIMLGLTGIYQLILWSLDMFESGVVLSGYLGLLLLGAAFLSLGLFISSLTENQIVAAVVSLGLLLLLWLVGWSSSKVEPTLGKILEYISLVQHLVNFARGIIDTADVVYYLLFSFLFLFLTLRSLESKRWRG